MRRPAPRSPDGCEADALDHPRMRLRAGPENRRGDVPAYRAPRSVLASFQSIRAPSHPHPTRGCETEPNEATRRSRERRAAGGRRTTNTWIRARMPGRLRVARLQSEPREPPRSRRRSSRIPQATASSRRLPTRTIDGLQIVDERIAEDTTDLENVPPSAFEL